MATSASFHGVVGLQNGNRYQIDKKSYWRYDGFIATPERDIRVNVFTFGANTASAEDGKSTHSLHLFAIDDLQPLPDGARAIPTVIIAGKVSRSSFSLKQENGFDMDVSQYLAATILRAIRVSAKLLYLCLPNMSLSRVLCKVSPEIGAL
ncbi:hypothetical protein BDR07DRAFT_1397269 [Suillus spraguei]|nr:hypothetical protein BDR07DRAFT_1397269 [Suillus spraguei]